MVAGLCGAQGSGKSTLAAAIRDRLALQGLRVVTVSLDDLYLTRTERLALALDIHPLLATRGPPGTHDVSLGCAVLARLRAEKDAVMPVFDKIADDRASPDRWPTHRGPGDIILFEGWCVGARPQPDAQLVEPINELERDRDPAGIWRAFVNRSLAHDYPALFGQTDRLVMLRAPNFEVVARWRLEQEVENRARHGGGGGMDEGQIATFIQHYERLTRWMLEEMPTRADLVLDLDETRRIIRVTP